MKKPHDDETEEEFEEEETSLDETEEEPEVEETEEEWEDEDTEEEAEEEWEDEEEETQEEEEETEEEADDHEEEDSETETENSHDLETKEEEKILGSNELHSVAKEKEKKAPTLHDIPLNIIVEVGRLQMPIKTLMELKPGNLLDFSVHPELGVDLVVNGCRIGKGELVQIGEVLGIRVLELG